jgi:hypothetical protein
MEMFMITNGSSFGYSDTVTLDADLPYASTYIYSGDGGDIVYLNTAGEEQWFKGAAANQFIPIAAKKILTSGTVNGTSRTTSATNMVYCCSVKA